MKKLFTFFILFFLLVSVNATNIRINSLGHQRYGIESCYHDGNCTYYSSDDNITIPDNGDAILKIVDARPEFLTFDENSADNIVNFLENSIILLCGIIVIYGGYLMLKKNRVI